MTTYMYGLSRPVEMRSAPYVVVNKNLKSDYTPHNINCILRATYPVGKLTMKKKITYQARTCGDSLRFGFFLGLMVSGEMVNIFFFLLDWCCDRQFTVQYGMALRR